jgi:hypothetical protein
VVFIEARDLLDAVRVQVARARGQLAQTAEARTNATRRDELTLAAAAAGIAALALLVLVPPPRSDAAAPALAGAAPSSTSGAREPEEYARVVSTAKAVPAAAPIRTAPPLPVARPASAARPAARPADTAAAQAGRWPDAAALCSDIARVSDSAQIGAVLGRAAGLLKASGIVLWMASDARDKLTPAVTTGYDDRLVARLGSISRDDVNLTARAFSESAAKTSKGNKGSAAALAVPLVTQNGAVGVFSAEFRDTVDVDPQQLAIATIVAAQLSLLLANAADGSRAETAPVPDEAATPPAEHPASQAHSL